MSDVTVGIKQRSWEQFAAMFKSYQLAAVEMAGENQVITAVARRSPDRRKMGAQNAKVPFGHGIRLRAGNDNHARSMLQSGSRIVNPFPSTTHYRVANPVQAQLVIMIAADGQHRRHIAKRADQLMEFTEFRCVIDEVAAEQNSVRAGGAYGFDDLPAKIVGPSSSQMNVADIHQAAGVAPQRQAFLSNVKGALKTDFQPR